MKTIETKCEVNEYDNTQDEDEDEDEDDRRNLDGDCDEGNGREIVFVMLRHERQNVGGDLYCGAPL